MNWIEFSKNFVKSLGFKPNIHTSQINRYEDMIKAFQTVERINGILKNLDINQWMYISINWFNQQMRAGEIDPQP